jgi:hypothetical protein
MIRADSLRAQLRPLVRREHPGEVL